MKFKEFLINFDKIQRNFEEFSVLTAVKLSIFKLYMKVKEKLCPQNIIEIEKKNGCVSI